MAAKPDDEDELERLLDMYTAEAAEQSQRLEAKARRMAQPRKETAVREAGLQQPLGAGNKGYALLRKMGYEEGKGLGSSGRAEPLPLDLKSGRAGIGVDEQRKRERDDRQRQEELDRAKRARLVSEAQRRYQDTARSGYNARQTVRHLRGAWRVAEQLDERAAAAACGDRRLAGTETARLGAEPDLGAEQLQPGQRSAVLQALLTRLSDLVALLDEAEEGVGAGQGLAEGGQVAGQMGGAAKAQGGEDEEVAAVPTEGAGLACLSGGRGAGGPGGGGSATAVAAGVAEGDTAVADTGGGGAGDSVAGRAGGERADSGDLPGADGGADGGAEGGADGGEVGAGGGGASAPSLSEQLDLLLLHLREQHCYCYFCGCQYDSLDDLASSCPGLGEDAH